MTTKKKPATKPVAKPEITKRAQLIALLEREAGATLDEMVIATNWLPHTTRAAMTGLRKAGMTLESDKTDNVRRYRIVASPSVAQ